LSSRLQLTGSQLIDTAQLSNLGQLDEAPWWVRTGCRPDHQGVVSAPARMSCGLCLGVATLAGRMHWFSGIGTPSRTGGRQRFTERYLTELDRLVSGVTA
jgi:hypothetical protein